MTEDLDIETINICIKMLATATNRNNADMFAITQLLVIKILYKIAKEGQGVVLAELFSKKVISIMQQIVDDKEISKEPWL
jgi:hypothetical protein